MAPIQEPEIQFAQKLASNQKPIRTKAIKKLRKYISLRSQKTEDGFTNDEVLKLWKGLFYCLWMQDKPLLQEELSKQISGLLLSFQNVESQFLFLSTFLQTICREWTGIDMLRMDKFFQLVRFMFRQTFEVLKKKNWETSLVARFLELLTDQILQSGKPVPRGLQFHILDLYMTELAGVGSAELTADQNLTFINPFCKTAARTKDRILFKAICSSIFSTIIDQAPFALEDLMREIKAAGAEDSDSGQASEEEEEENEKMKSKTISKRGTGKQRSGIKVNKEDKDGGDYDEDHLEEDSAAEVPDDGEIGPVLQFDYGALVQRLFELASRSNTPSHNRQRLYKIIKVLRDLNEGIFPQDEYPEEVSTDEDDDMFGSRRRMKRGRGSGPEEDMEEGGPVVKKKKGKKKEKSAPETQNKDMTKDASEPGDLATDAEKKKRKKKKKKKQAGKSQDVGEEKGQTSVVLSIETKTQSAINKENPSESTIAETGCSPPATSAKNVGDVAKMETSISSADSTEVQPTTVYPLEVKCQASLTSTEEASQSVPQISVTTVKDQSNKLSRKRKKSKVILDVPNPLVVVTEIAVEQSTSLSQEVEAAAMNARQTTAPEVDAEMPAKKKQSKRGLEVENKADMVVAESATEHLTSDMYEVQYATAEDAPTILPKKNVLPENTSVTNRKKKKGRRVSSADIEAVDMEAEGGSVMGEIPSVVREVATEDATTTPRKKTTKKGKREVNMVKEEETTPTTQEDMTPAPLAADICAVTPSKRNKKMSKVVAPVEMDATVSELPQKMNAAVPTLEVAMKTLVKKSKKKPKPAAAHDCEIEGLAQFEVTDGTTVGSYLKATPPEREILSPTEKRGKKKRKIPVVFEFEADEIGAKINGLAEEETAVKKTNLSNDVVKRCTPQKSKKSEKKTKAGLRPDFITFQSNASIPVPLFCKLKGSPKTPLSYKKKSPSSESKKVTFGLNKTAEFRKTDRSLLLSPEGSSRVPFDPEQKPKFGVLKFPATSIRKTPKANGRTISTLKNTPKKRMTAADFF